MQNDLMHGKLSMWQMIVPFCSYLILVQASVYMTVCMQFSSNQALWGRAILILNTCPYHSLGQIDLMPLAQSSEVLSEYLVQAFKQIKKSFFEEIFDSDCRHPCGPIWCGSGHPCVGGDTFLQLEPTPPPTTLVACLLQKSSKMDLSSLAYWKLL